MDISASSVSEINGVTKLENKIYVLCYRPNSIRVFEDKIPFHLLHKIKIKDVKNPYDIGSSERSKCLYVSDEGNRCIWKITADDHRLTKLVTNIGEPFTLSVSSDDYLLILRRNQPNNQLETYRADGKLIRSISLPTDIKWSYHCIQKPTGEFVISHLDEKCRQYVISQLTDDGQNIIGRFQSNESSFYPLHLSLDYENNRLFAADYNKHKVSIIDSNSFQLKQILLMKEKHGISHPLRFFYDSKKQQLIVGHSDDKATVYEII